MTPSEIKELQLLAQSQWPDFSLTQDELLDCAARAGWESSFPLQPERAADLYLVCACSLGKESAVSAFEARHQGDILRALRPMGLPEALQSEIQQAVRTKLFVRKEGRGLQIEKFTGRGSLAGWVRAVSVRTAIDILRKEKSDEVAVDAPVLEALAEADVDPDIRAMKRQHRLLVNQAFEAGFTELSVRQRNILRQHYIHRLNIDQLGAMYKVHRATAFRWVAKARAEVFSTARQHVAQVLGEEKEEAEELLRLLQSQVDLSLDRLLRSQAES